MRCRVAATSAHLTALLIVAAAAPVIDEYSILNLPTGKEAGSSGLTKVLLDSHLEISPLHKTKNPKLDCLSQRVKSLARRNDGDLLVYVPLCSPKNTTYYQAIQCHDETKYCWCVHIATGEPIPGSTSLIDKPRCISETLFKKKERKRDRCFGIKRSRFLRRLTASLKTEMIMAGNNTRAKVGRDTAIAWKFSQLDKNKNRVIERAEWKPYKSVLLQWKRVRRCSRNLFKTCDLDKNKRLSPGEWKQCLAREINRVPAKRPEQLNPFLFVLKAD